MAEFSDWEKTEMEELKKEIEEYGVSNIEEFLRSRLEKWREVEVNIAITGNAGTGKSSFINVIRQLKDDDEGAARVGVTQCTMEPTAYDHPTNTNIKFWDLPGIGTPNYPDLETYCEKVELEKYHTYLIFTATRFTVNDLLLAQKVRSIGKKFFFIRTKIDVDALAGRRRRRVFDEQGMLTEIRLDCLKGLGELLSNQQDVFLISNLDPDKWEFAGLTQAILDALTRYQRESMTLSLGKVITTSSSDIFQRKVDILRGRIWMVAMASGAAAAVPVPGLSFVVDGALILRELSFYRTQLGLPEIESAEFAKLHFVTKDKVLRVVFTTAAQLSGLLAEAGVEEATRFIPIVGLVVASCMSFGATYFALSKLLTSVEEVAKLVLKETAKKAAADLEQEGD